MLLLLPPPLLLVGLLLLLPPPPLLDVGWPEGEVAEGLNTPNSTAPITSRTRMGTVYFLYRGGIRSMRPLTKLAPSFAVEAGAGGAVAVGGRWAVLAMACEWR